MNTSVIKSNPKIRQFEKVFSIVEEMDFDSSRLITILQKVQDEYRYLPEEVLVYLATVLDIPVAEVYGVATFYAHFTLEAKGKYVIKICDGTACHVKGSSKLYDVIMKKLKLNNASHTTSDMLFTVETVSCLGACGLAPVMVINDDVYGQVNEEKVNTIIGGILKKEGVENAY